MQIIYHVLCVIKLFPLYYLCNNLYPLLTDTKIWIYYSLHQYRSLLEFLIQLLGCSNTAGEMCCLELHQACSRDRTWCAQTDERPKMFWSELKALHATIVRIVTHCWSIEVASEVPKVHDATKTKHQLLTSCRIVKARKSPKSTQLTVRNRVSPLQVSRRHCTLPVH